MAKIDGLDILVILRTALRHDSISTGQIKHVTIDGKLNDCDMLVTLKDGRQFKIKVEETLSEADWNAILPGE